MPPPTPSKPAINPATTPAATMAPAKARSISIPYSNVDHLENIMQRNQVDTNLVLKEPLRYQGTGAVSSCTHVSLFRQQGGRDSICQDNGRHSCSKRNKGKLRRTGAAAHATCQLPGKGIRKWQR